MKKAGCSLKSWVTNDVLKNVLSCSMVLFWCYFGADPLNDRHQCTMYRYLMSSKVGVVIQCD
jgi:hypothetical protein